jgi:hypothetical protein
MITTEIEKQNLEAHVEICAIRYASLETKLSNLDDRIDKVESKLEKVEGHLIEIKGTLLAKTAEQPSPKGEDANPYKTMITIGTTIIGVLITGIITLLVKLYH